jgi:hypothetical protein
MTTPEESIISRSREIRAGRRLRAGATALAAAIGLVVAVTALTTSAPSRSSDVRLTAWSVVSKPGGLLLVTIRELRDPAGLERRLLANGIPANITYHGQPNPACRRYPADRRRYDRVLPPFGRGARSDGLILIWIQALPRGAGVQLGATVRRGHLILSAPKLIYATPACTDVYQPSP